jgi:hypothetical protein
VLQRHNQLRPSVLAQDGRGGVAGKQVNEGEEDDRQAEENRDGTEEASNDVSQHGWSITDA